MSTPATQGSATQADTGTQPRTPLRLRLTKNATRSNGLDGAWWPQSRDLQVEAADLLDDFPHEQGRILRLLFSQPDWDREPGVPSTRRVRAGRGFVKVGSFPHDDTHVMVLQMQSGRRVHLLVVPSAASADEAADLMRRATDPANTASAPQLLGLS